MKSKLQSSLMLLLQPFLLTSTYRHPFLTSTRDFTTRSSICVQVTTLLCKELSSAMYASLTLHLSDFLLAPISIIITFIFFYYNDDDDDKDDDFFILLYFFIFFIPPQNNHNCFLHFDILPNFHIFFFYWYCTFCTGRLQPRHRGTAVVL